MPGGLDTPERHQRRIDAGLVASAGAMREPTPSSLVVARNWSGSVLEERPLPTNGDSVYRPQPAPYNRRYGRRASAGGALVASAAHIPLDDRKAVESVRRRHQAWQTEAWDYFDEVGEIGYTTTYIANLMSKLRLYPAIEGPKGDPIPLSLLDEDPPDDPDSDPNKDARSALDEAGVTDAVATYAEATLRRLRSMQGGQSALLREMSLNLEVAGELYIHGHATPSDIPEPGNTVDYGPVGSNGNGGYGATNEMGVDPSLIEDWNIRSVDELIITGDKFELRLGPGTKVAEPIPDTDLVIRVWERHPRFSELATCAMRRVLAEAEALLLLSREVRATSKSRLSNGILLVPSELSFGSIDPTNDMGDGEETNDPFDAELQEAMITPIQEEGSASAVVPLVLRGPADLLQHVNHLALDKTLDPVLDERIEQRILRIARGLNMPTEVTTGLMSTTFANAVQVKRSEFEDHIEPRAILVCDAITSGYFQWALEVGSGIPGDQFETGLDPEIAKRIFVWFDASQLIRVEDQSEMAVAAQQDGIISAQARRRYCGFTEADAPDMDELALLGLTRASRMDPTLQDYLWRKVLGDDDIPITAPAAGVLGMGQSVSAMPAPGAPPQGTIQVAGLTVDTPPPPPPPPPVTVIHQTPDGTPTDEQGQPADQTAQTAQTPAPGAEAGADSKEPVASSAAFAGDGEKAKWKKLGARLAGIDRDLRTRLIVKLDAAMTEALARAGNRIKSRVQRDKNGKASMLGQAAKNVQPGHVAAYLGKGVVGQTGLKDADLVGDGFEQVLHNVVDLMDDAYTAAVQAVERATGPVTQARRAQMDVTQAQQVAEAVGYLHHTMIALAAARLYQPTPDAPAQGEYDRSVLVPANLVRAAIAIAGGGAVKGAEVNAHHGSPQQLASAWIDLGGAGSVSDPDGGAVGGIGTGPNVMGAVSDAGGSIEAYQWDYGEAIRHRQFIPHLNLDGQIVADPNDSSGDWANNAAFPEATVYYPGDHDGCMCDLIPVIIPPEGGVLLQTPTGTAPLLSPSPAPDPGGDPLAALYMSPEKAQEQKERLLAGAKQALGLPADASEEETSAALAKALGPSPEEVGGAPVKLGGPDITPAQPPSAIKEELAVGPGPTNSDLHDLAKASNDAQTEVAAAKEVAQDTQIEMNDAIHKIKGTTGDEQQAALENAADKAQAHNEANKAVLAAEAKAKQAEADFQDALSKVAAPPKVTAATKQPDLTVKGHMASQAEMKSMNLAHQGAPYRIANKMASDYGVTDDDAKAAINEMGWSYLRSTSKPAEDLAQTLIESWAGSSNDDDPQMLFLHDLAKEKFGLENTTEWGQHISDSTQAKIASYKASPVINRVFGAFLDTMYDSTQEEFAKRGITSVTLYRGSGFRSDPPQWLRDVYKAGGNAILDKPALRPLSSFSWDAQLAQSFGRSYHYAVVYRQEMPVEKILSFARTGMGTEYENEAVVLGGMDQLQVDVVRYFD
jgi:hypothetical protein